MAKVHSKSSKFKWNGIELSDDVLSVSFDRNIEEADVTTLGSTAKEFLVGLTDNMLELEGFWGTGASEAHTALAADFAAGTSRAWSFGPAGVGGVSYDGTAAYITAFNVTAAVGNAVAFSASIRVTGLPTVGTYSLGT